MAEATSRVRIEARMEQLLDRVQAGEHNLVPLTQLTKMVLDGAFEPQSGPWAGRQVHDHRLVAFIESLSGCDVGS